MSVTLNPDDIALVDAVVKEIERRKEAWRLSDRPDALPRLREAVQRWTAESKTKASLTDEGWHKIQLIAGLYHLLPWSDQRDNRPLPGDGVPATPPGREPLEWGDDAHFDIPEWEELDSSFTAQEMSRHFFIVGETGSGKSKSAVIPLLTSCLRFEADSPDSRASILLIDPKFELKNVVTDFINERSNERDIIEFSIDDPKSYINFFSPADNNAPDKFDINDMVDAILNANRQASAMGRSQSDQFWAIHGRQMLVSLLEMDYFARTHGENFSIWQIWNEACVNLAKDARSEKLGGSVEARSGKGAEGAAPLPERIPIPKGNYFAPFLSFLKMSFANQKQYWLLMDRALTQEFKKHPFTPTCQQRSMQYSGEYSGVANHAVAALDIFASPDVNRLISFDPYFDTEGREDQRLIDIIAEAERGSIFIYAPTHTVTSTIADTIGRTLKTAFFKATFLRANKRRPIVYICDEFHRFISDDAESGEQSYLDRCRAYRGICVLATQSIDSLTHALGSGVGSSSDNGRSALSVVLNNSGNKLFFRSTDIETTTRLSLLLPEPPPAPGNQHIVRKRPLGTLSVGECYYLFSDGTWGRGQVRLSKSTARKQSEIAKVRLTGAVNSESIIKLCDEIDLQVNYYRFRDVRVEIDSPGGDSNSLEYLIARMYSWRQHGVSIGTRGLTAVSSAAAVVLSLGNPPHRRAFSPCSLLYHNGRVGGEKPYSYTDFELISLAQKLHLVNFRYIDLLAHQALDSGLYGNEIAALRQHIIDGYKQSDDEVRSNTRSAGSDDFIHGDDGSAPFLPKGGDEDVLARILSFARAGLLHDGDPPQDLEKISPLEALRAIYAALFSLDMTISPFVARKLVLIDGVL